MKKEKTKSAFSKKKISALLSRIAIAMVAISIAGVLVLWDVGIINLPFLERHERRKPVVQTEEKNTEDVLTVVDWAAFAKDSANNLYELSAIVGGNELVTDALFDANTMSIVKTPLTDGNYRCEMGFLIKTEGEDSELIYTVPAQNELIGVDGYQLSYFWDNNGNALFQNRAARNYVYFDSATQVFLPSQPQNRGSTPDLDFPVPFKAQGEDAPVLIEENGLYGYKGQYQQGKKTVNFTVEPQYPYAYPYSEGYAVMADKDGKITIRDCRGEMVFQGKNFVLTEKEGEEAMGFFAFDNGVLRVTVGTYDEQGNLSSRRESILSADGKEISLPTGYDAISYNEGVFLVTNGSLYGYVSSHGAWLVDPIYTDATPFFEGIAVVTDKDGKKGLIDRKGTILLPCAFDEISAFSKGNALAFSEHTGWLLLSKVNGVFSSEGKIPQTSKEYYTKITITRGPQNTFDYEPDEIIILTTPSSTPSRTTHPENTLAP